MDPEHRAEEVLTEPQVKALTILQNHGPLRPREFARLMWPDSPGWQRHARCGPNGSHKGGGMYLAAGGYLGKLARKGWIYRKFKQYSWGYDSMGYILNGPGKTILRLHREEAEND